MDERQGELPPPYTTDRRRFLNRLSMALSGLIALLIGAPVVGFFLAPLWQKQQQAWRGVGAAGKFKVGQTVEVSFTDSSPLAWAGYEARTAAWLRRESSSEFSAFSVNCTHLGCPVHWEPSATLFFCPCHGGVYYQDGTVAAGPPPQPLPRYPVRVRNGQVEIRTTPLPITTSITVKDLKP